MNPKGHEPNLKRANPGNRNSEKSGVYSARRRAEEERKVRQALAGDPRGYTAQDLRDMYVEARGLSHLLERDVAERGVSDRHGKPRRLAGTLVRTLTLCTHLNEQIQATLAAEAEQYDEAEAFSVAEGMSLLRGMAHDGRVGGSARVAAIRYLLEHLPELMSEAEDQVSYQIYKELEKLTDEELQREIEMLRVPVSAKPQAREAAEEMLRRLASETEIKHEQLLDLHRALTEDLELDDS